MSDRQQQQQPQENIERIPQRELLSQQGQQSGQERQGELSQQRKLGQELSDASVKVTDAPKPRDDVSAHYHSQRTDHQFNKARQ